MKNYRFIIEVPAESEEQAKRKLDLLMEVGAFLKTFDVSTLSGTLIYYMLLSLGRKCSSKLNDSSKQ